MHYDRIVLMGSPEFSLPTLRVLNEVFSERLISVFSQPDAPKGRNRQMSPTPITAMATDLQIPVYTPESKSEIESALVTLDPTLIVVIAYGRILPKSVTDRFICLNLHGSLLPRYRGASPIQAALLNGEVNTGVTLMKMNEYMDQGDILDQAEVEIGSDETFGRLHDRLAQLSADVLISYLIRHEADSEFIGVPQDPRFATYCAKIHKADTELFSRISAREFVAKVKAFSPVPGAFLMKNQTRYKILDARLNGDQVEIVTIQPQGKPPMAYRDYLLGHPEGVL